MDVCLPNFVSEAVWNAGVAAPPNAKDILLDRGWIYSASREQIGAVPWRFDGPGEVAPVAMTLDTMGGDRLERAPGHVLLSGTIALPYRMPLSGDTFAPALVRLTGERHGSMRAIAQVDRNHMLLAGRAGIAHLDASRSAPRILSWGLTATASGPEMPRVLVAADGMHAVDRDLVYIPQAVDESMPCMDFRDVGFVDGDRNETWDTLCNLMDGTFDAGPTRVWANTMLSSVAPAVGELGSWSAVRGWQRDTLPAPALEIAASGCTPPSGHRIDYDATRVRVSSDGNTLLAFSPLLLYADPLPEAPVLPTVVGYCVRTFDTTQETAPLLQSAVVFAPGDLGTPAWSTVASDGDDALVAAGRQLRHFQFSALADPVWPHTIDLSCAAPDQPLQVAWMDRGRAWIASVGGAVDGAPEMEFPFHLSQVAYGTAALVNEGFLPLLSPITNVTDTGSAAVATTPTEVMVITPACR